MLQVEITTRRERDGQLHRALELAHVVRPSVVGEREHEGERHRSIRSARTAQEVEPKGKAATEVKALLSWLCDKVIMLPSNQVTESTKKRA